MDTRKRGTTPEMQVTSIRLEPELKERLREISGDRGYQFLIREVLWQFVQHQTSSHLSGPTSRESWPVDTSATIEPSVASPQISQLSRWGIRAIFRAIAQQETQCIITGQRIRPQQTMWLGLTDDGNLVPLSHESLI